MRRILLHVGSPKCGSTYLQQVMLKNRDHLAAHGLAYPHDGGLHPGNAAGLGDLTAATLDRMFGDAHTLILSHEDLYDSARWGKPLAALAADMDIAVQVLVFLRPFAEFVYGDYSQQMKQYFPNWLKDRDPYAGQTFDVFAGRRTAALQPARFIDNWAALFPAPPPILAPHRDIRAVIEPLLGDIPPLDWTLRRDIANPSLRTADCEALAEALRDPQRSPDDLKAMLHMAFHAAGGVDPGRSPRRTAYIEALFAPQNAALMQRFGYDNTMPVSGEPGSRLAARATQIRAELLYALSRLHPGRALRRWRLKRRLKQRGS